MNLPLVRNLNMVRYWLLILNGNTKRHTKRILKLGLLKSQYRLFGLRVDRARKSQAQDKPKPKSNKPPQAQPKPIQRAYVVTSQAELSQALVMDRARNLRASLELSQAWARDFFSVKTSLGLTHP